MDAQIGRRRLLLLLLFGEVNAPPVLRTPLSVPPLTAWEADTAETAASLVTSTPSMSRRRSGRRMRRRGLRSRPTLTLLLLPSPTPHFP